MRKLKEHEYRSIWVRIIFYIMWVVTLSCRISVPASGEVLENGKIKAVFNKDGLVLIMDKKDSYSMRFIKDDFSFMVDSINIDSRNLKATNVISNSSQIEYSYHFNDYNLKIVYELKPDWQFVSKQLFIESTSKSDMRINKMVVISGALDEIPLDEYIPQTTRPEFETGEYGSFLRFENKKGLMVLVQNPFLNWERHENTFSISYNPEMDWSSEYGAFASDRACIGIYNLSGRTVSAQLIPEWKWNTDIKDSVVQDEAEIQAFTDCVNAFVLSPPNKSIKMNCGWCENDYQIDVATPEGRTEYKRIIDRSAELGLDYILYAPTHSEMGNRKETADDWGWESVLWLGMGTKIRKGLWDPEHDELPASIQEMLEYAKSKNIKLVSYLYPVMPFEGNSEWIVEGSKYHRKKRNASIGVRSFQDWLIRKLGAFYERNGIGGYSYDYTFLWYKGTSRYAQWAGWKRIKEELRRKYPEMVIDGRQLDMCYGPWTWVSGSYPHPTASDEQPESFVPFPDLHFDRVSANRQRYTAYRYRVNDYCPPVLMPGFITHQTSRSEGDTEKGGRKLRMDSFRQRDWDYLGWKYSLISSIATGGLNNIVSMIPARDMHEYENFSKPDQLFFKNWLKWTDVNRAYLLNTKFILGQPAIGKVDGTSAIIDDIGYVFLFNPNGRKMRAEFTLNDEIGLTKGETFTITELFPNKNLVHGKPKQGIFKYGDKFSIEMDGASALVLKITPNQTTQAILFNVTGDVSIQNRRITLNNVSGKVGKKYKALIVLPNSNKMEELLMNNKRIDFEQAGKVISFNIEFDGEYFGRMHQVDHYDPEFSGGTISGTFKIPDRIKEQLNERKKQWPIPWTKEDYQTTWLVPERQLLFLQIAEVKEDMEIQLKIDGEQVALSKAYSSVRAHPACFVGFYVDLSKLSTKQHTYEIQLPDLEKGQYQGLFFENIVTEYTSKLNE
jgi:hypothetical protein